LTLSLTLPLAEPYNDQEASRTEREEDERYEREHYEMQMCV